ncbi:1-(5-phosphoribosyl)-5-[(5-phosphoribosylamino)methylideneamino]imidazole-4-carboxamide isomerase [Methylacidiphilum caldifontis]|uniref:1-(5-phosphoribosyl)-5-[(5-phosphoribosylamino)methylideneamino] imidazole-4-carboxamide isomerase n=1 Tax=Methylacidiphilum caldifontis TaxID=2795386 RepID=A0A4Y8PCT1_9BACT|nr:1-(5-phosphoribosyl)-5-[(5-phosphoribosylamino)methylideneamino]imidazole-4-carboxamide isomerase [Methylacidiphilum caldifontis]QSR89524.1 1-(5-phosphoribosyl)-5-[(5-phosphoribosylamino)methylideneamino]imidazole-4-carboxamide isomerase [Methylacidiphilum caldifontis]TFE67698.1 1-(5-phosphoribosyl)-5-[(5-phosphoribosylamino)methylideneamino]imidazole-4-carboxamide isomerase [Methylacidiphilum caldifontis]
MKIYAAIDLFKGQVVRLRQGKIEEMTVYSSDPVKTALFWQEQGADGLHIVDLQGAFEGKPQHLALLEKIAQVVTLPIQFGGGLRTEEQALKAIEKGAQRVIIGSRLVTDPEFLDNLSKKLGSEKIVAALDTKNGEVQVEGWKKSSGYTVENFIKWIKQKGVGFLLYTNIQTDGTLNGPDIKGTQAVVKMSSLPVFASGGIGCDKDLEELQKIKDLYGAILGRSLYEGKISLVVKKKKD